MRHGATAWNAASRFQGRTDTQLSDQGRDQARAIATTLAREPVDRIYSSDLARAFETAQAICDRRPIEIRADPRLREFDFGAWEGLTWPEIAATRPQLSASDWASPALYAPDGGETFDRVRTRLASFWNDVIAAEGGGRHVVVVTHAGPLHATLAVLGIEAPGARFMPASLTRIAMEAAGARLITLSDVRHLDPSG